MSDDGHPADHPHPEESPQRLPDGVSASSHEFGGAYLYVTREILVARQDEKRLLDDLARRGLAGEVRSVGRDLRLVQLPQRAVDEDAQFVPQLVTRLRALDDAIAVSPHHVVGGVAHSGRITVGPPKPAGSLASIDAREGLPGSGATVAVLDTGMVDPIPAWFDGTATPLTGAGDVEPAPAGTTLEDPAGHGTLVAGIVRRYAPGANIVFHRVLDDLGYVGDIQLSEAVRQVAARADVQVINLSLGGYSHDGVDGLPATAAAIEDVRLARPDLVIVAGAGNDGGDRPFYPAAYQGVVGVAALGLDGERACFSNYGPWVNCAAEGVDVVSTYLDVDDVKLWPPTFEHNCLGVVATGDERFSFHSWASASGTSVAAPAVSGAIAAEITRGKTTAREASWQLTEAPGVVRKPGLGAIVAAEK